MGESKKKSNGTERVSEARRRTRSRMQTLLAAGAATGAGFVLSACPVTVDPMPTPLECSTDQPSTYFEQWIETVATWSVSEGGTPVVALTFHSYQQGELDFSEPIETEGGTADVTESTGTDVSLTVEPDANATTVRVTVPLVCKDHGDAYVVELDVTGEPNAGSTVPFTVVD